ncbi:MAG: uridine kinase [Bacteroidota bacterium]
MSAPIIVGVAGGSGSGKTLFIRKLVARIPDVSIHSMDNYYINRELQPKDRDGIENFDTLDSIDRSKFIQDLHSLARGESVVLEEYNYNNPDHERKQIEIKSSRVIIVEGIFTFHIEEIRSLLNLKLFIEAPDFLMLKRRIIRDAEERGYDINDVLYRFEHHVTPAFKTYIEPSRKWADVIIPNHHNFDVALEVIINYLNP